MCAILEIKQSHYALQRLDEDEKSYVGRTHLGLKPGKDMIIVNEPGLYSLILRSRKPAAKKFKRWITHEVKQGHVPVLQAAISAHPQA